MSFRLIVINQRIALLFPLLLLLFHSSLGFDFKNEDHMAHLYRRANGNCDTSFTEGAAGPNGGVMSCVMGQWVEDCSRDHDDRDPDPRGGTWFCSTRYQTMLQRFGWKPFTWYRSCNVDLIDQLGVPYPGTTGGFTTCSGPCPLHDDLVPYIWYAGCDPNADNSVTLQNPWGRQEGDLVDPSKPDGKIWYCETDRKSSFKWVQKDRFLCCPEHEHGERDLADDKKEWTCNADTKFMWKLITLDKCNSDYNNGDDGYAGGFWRCSGPNPINGNMPKYTWYLGCDDSHNEGNYCDENEDDQDKREGGYWHCSGPNPCDTMIKKFTWFRTCHNGHYDGEPGPEPNTYYLCTGATTVASGIEPFKWAIINNSTSTCRLPA